MADHGVVLDFDGVIIQSMEVHAESYRLVLAPHGVKVHVDDIYVREGGRSESIIKDLLEQAGHRVDADEVHRLAVQKQETFSRLGPPPFYPGANEMVRRVRDATHKLGLVTGTRKENLARFIPHLLPLFDATLAQDAYLHDKPHPEPYEKAAKALSIGPQRLAALENAERGVQSAKRAGYAFVVGLTTTRPREALRAAGADAVVGTHEEAASTLRDWLADRQHPKASL